MTKDRKYSPRKTYLRIRTLWLTIFSDSHLDVREDLKTISQTELISSSCWLAQKHRLFPDFINGTINNSVSQVSALGVNIYSSKQSVYSDDHPLCIYLGMFISFHLYWSIEVQSIASFSPSSLQQPSDFFSVWSYVHSHLFSTMQGESSLQLALGNKTRCVLRIPCQCHQEDFCESIANKSL